MRDPYWVYGGLQDNGTFGAPNQTRERSGLTNAHWVRAGGGDGFYAAIDPTDHDVVFVESQNGNISRFDFATQERKGIRPGNEPGQQVRYNWSAPMLISPHDPRTLWFGSNYLYRSPDHGDTWETVSPDLTRALDRDTLEIGGLRTAGGFQRHTGTAAYGNLATIDESPLAAGVLYTGSDDGVVAVSRDRGANWAMHTSFPGVPDLTYVSRVEASNHVPGRAYAAFDGHRANDFRPYILRTDDYGATWTSVSGNLPEEGSVQVVREHHEESDLLFAGTEFGAFVTTNGGQSWTRLAGLPTVAVHDLVIHPRDNDLVVATHGLGIWIYDDVGILQRVAAAAREGRPAISTEGAATVMNLHAGPTQNGIRRFAVGSRGADAMLTYFVPAGTAEPLALTVVDASGTLVRELAATGQPGTYRTEWDLRWSSPEAEGARNADSAPPQPASGQEEEEEEEDGPPRFQQNRQAPGPWVEPGAYRVQIRGGGQVLAEAPLTVRRDPAVTLASTEWAELYAVRRNAYEVQREAHALVRRLEAAAGELEGALEGKAENAPGVSDARAAAAVVEELLATVRVPQARQVGRGGFGGGGGPGGNAPPSVLQRVNGVAGAVGSSHFLPTQAQRADLDSARQDLATAAGRAETELARVPALVRALGN
jgi:hypothetical protein